MQKLLLLLSVLIISSCITSGNQGEPDKTLQIEKPKTIFDHVRTGNTGEIIAYAKAGGDVNVKDSRGWPILHIAVEKGDLASVQALVDNKVNVSEADRDLRTALMKASYFQFTEIMKTLLAAGADYTMVDSGGETALAKCKYHHNVEVEKILREAGATQ